MRGAAPRQPRFVIWAPSYSEIAGGTIVLHTLCDRLNQLGVPAAIWPGSRPGPKALFTWRGIVRWAAHIAQSLFRPFDMGPFKNPIARLRDLRNAIVVYPEVVSGNPLGSRQVVRWFLYKPGKLTGRTDYSENELYFFFNPVFNDESINNDDSNLLRMLMMHECYKKTNFGNRSGSCFIVRKGKDRVLDQHPPDAICVDDMSHEEKAEIFNNVEYFYSYDLYTLYSVYAALCGCISVIVPEAGTTRDEWEPLPERRAGLAYGASEVPWAVETRPQLIERLRKEREEEDQLVRIFVEKCLARFGANPSPDE